MGFTLAEAGELLLGRPMRVVSFGWGLIRCLRGRRHSAGKLGTPATGRTLLSTGASMHCPAAENGSTGHGMAN